MSTRSPAAGRSGRFRRPDLERTAPDRSAGALYRAAEGPGGAIGGVPLTSAEDAVVAAVRMGYRVAEAQIDRADRLADRLRAAGEHAVGPEPERQAVDATERLLGKAMVAGLGWLEGLAAEVPTRLWSAAQDRWFDRLFGAPLDDTTPPAARPMAPPASGGPGPRPPRAAVRVVHDGGARRPVEVRRLQLDVPDASGEFALVFFHRERLVALSGSALRLQAHQPATLVIVTAQDTPPDAWRAAICADDGAQIGWIEIEL